MVRGGHRGSALRAIPGPVTGNGESRSRRAQPGRTTSLTNAPDNSGPSGSPDRGRAPGVDALGSGRRASPSEANELTGAERIGRPPNVHLENLGVHNSLRIRSRTRDLPPGTLRPCPSEGILRARSDRRSNLADPLDENSARGSLCLDLGSISYRTSLRPGHGRVRHVAEGSRAIRNQADREAALRDWAATAPGEGLATQARMARSDRDSRVSALTMATGSRARCRIGAAVALVHLPTEDWRKRLSAACRSLADLSLGAPTMLARARSRRPSGGRSIPSTRGGIIAGEQILEIVSEQLPAPDGRTARRLGPPDQGVAWSRGGQPSCGPRLDNRIAGSIPELGSLTIVEDLSLGGFSYRLAGFRTNSATRPICGPCPCQTGVKGESPSQLERPGQPAQAGLGDNQLAGSIPLNSATWSTCRLSTSRKTNSRARFRVSGTWPTWSG